MMAHNKSLNKVGIKLAPLSFDDSETLYRWINDRTEVTKNAAYRPVHYPSHERWFAAIAERSDMVIFGIRTQAGDRLIGSCQLHSISPVHRSAELQIRIGEAAERGQGYGAQAVRLLLEFGFRDLNLNRIYLEVFADNAPAIRTYEKCGFVREGLARQAAFIDGSLKDVVSMALLASDWHIIEDTE